MGEPGDVEPVGRAHRNLEKFVERVAAPGDLTDQTAALDRAAVEAFDAFEMDGIEALLLKGPALSRLLYTAGEHRSYSDVDLLVAPRNLERARGALARLGYRNASEALGIDDVGGVVHEETWAGPAQGAEHELLIELHLRLAGAEAPPETAWDALAARRTHIELGGRHLAVLDREGQAMHLATHVAQHGPRYAKGIAELGLALERWPLEVWRGSAALARQLEATEAFAAGLRLVPAGAALAQRLGLPATDRLDWEIEVADSRPRGSFHLQALLQTRSLPARVGLLRRALLPSRQWIAWQHPWARHGGPRLILAYAVHLMRAPAWALRAWRFWRRSRRSAARPPA